ncbi:alpha-L-fucosidase [Nonomuraea sp. B5E05]|uniref:alpha-L-fucosidase n=1 Tax=Nonomuraea sp. B5E05 TaxID=3153569 RepID=UPI0032612C9F
MDNAAVETVTARRTPTWFDEEKLGIFIHWNPAVVAAYAPVISLERLLEEDATGNLGMRLNPYSDMHWNSMAIPGSPAQRYHEQHFPGAGYDALVTAFREEVLPAWDPAPWARLFARAGARYVVMTTKMDDGFLMWPSGHPNPFRDGWQARRDVVGELAEAVRGQGLRFGTYYSGGQDWTFSGLPLADLDAFMNGMPKGENYRAYVDNHWHDLIERYRPSLLWNDYSHPGTSNVQELFEHYWRQVPDGVINDRFADGVSGDDGAPEIYSDFLTPEQSTEGTPDRKWECCHTLGTAWGFNRMETAASHMSAEQLIHMFADIVSRGGNLLLNVGPTAAGTIPWLQAERLLALGYWLENNGEAIYRARPWTQTRGLTGDAQPVRYTASTDAIHAIVLGTPPERRLELHLRLEDGVRVTLAGRRTWLPWQRTAYGVSVRLPDQLDPSPAVSLRLWPKEQVHPLPENG